MGSHRHIVSICHIPHICPTCLVPSSVPRWLPCCLRMGHYAHSRSHLASRREGPLRVVCDQRWDKTIQSWIPTEVRYIHAIQCPTSDTILFGAVVCQILVHGTLLSNQCQGQISPYLVVRGTFLYRECLYRIGGRYRIQVQFWRVGVYHQWEQVKPNPIDLPWHWTTQPNAPSFIIFITKIECSGQTVLGISPRTWWVSLVQILEAWCYQEDEGGRNDLIWIYGKEAAYKCSVSTEKNAYPACIACQHKYTEILRESLKLTIFLSLVLSIPFLVLWKTRISLRKKLILLSIFSATIFIMVTAIIRVAVGMDYDRQMNIDWLCFWSFVEVDVGMLSQAFVRLLS